MMWSDADIVTDGQLLTAVVGDSLMNTFRLAAAVAFVGMSASVTNALSENLNLKTSVGKRVAVTEIRSPCTGGAAPDLPLLHQWMTEPLKYGVLEVGKTYQKLSKRCPGKTISMRQMYYRGKSKGIDTITIQWPETGFVTWTVQVK